MHFFRFSLYLIILQKYSAFNCAFQTFKERKSILTDQKLFLVVFSRQIYQENLTKKIEYVFEKNIVIIFPNNMLPKEIVLMILLHQ